MVLLMVWWNGWLHEWWLLLPKDWSLAETNVDLGQIQNWQYKYKIQIPDTNTKYKYKNSNTTSQKILKENDNVETREGWSIFHNRELAPIVEYSRNQVGGRLNIERTDSLNIDPSKADDWRGSGSGRHCDQLITPSETLWSPLSDWVNQSFWWSRKRRWWWCYWTFRKFNFRCWHYFILGSHSFEIISFLYPSIEIFRGDAWTLKINPQERRLERPYIWTLSIFQYL